jgi:trimethylamine--corrinoid protein Co-methyltransferase
MCLILIQLRKPGAPCFLGGNMSILDMKTTLMGVGAPEMSLGMAAQAEIARSFGLPTWGLAGSTDSKVLDAQAGVEGTFSILAQGLAGLNLIHDVGYMDMAMVCSTEMLVLGDEAIGMTKRFIRGIEVNSNTVAREVIEKVGPGGNFLGEKHTVEHYRNELWQPTLMTRQGYTKWKEDGSKDINQRIKEKIQDIVDNHEIPPLSENIVRRLKSIKQEGEKELIGKQ